MQKHTKKGTIHNGSSRPLNVFDELDCIKIMYGPQAALKLFEEAKPKLCKPFNEKIIFYGTSDATPH